MTGGRTVCYLSIVTLLEPLYNFLCSVVWHFIVFPIPQNGKFINAKKLPLASDFLFRKTAMVYGLLSLACVFP